VLVVDDAEIERGGADVDGLERRELDERTDPPPALQLLLHCGTLSHIVRSLARRV